MEKIIINENTLAIAKKQAEIALKECRLEIIGIIKKANELEKRKLADILNSGLYPLIKEEKKYVGL